MKKILCVSGLIKEIEKDEYSVKFDFTSEEQYLFRGQSDEDYEIIPSVGRYPYSVIGNQLLWFEQELINNAKNAFPEVFSNELTPIDLLGKLQHYGVPTRLLDVTVNPLVALYFSCCNDFDKNGELVVFIDKKVRPTKAGIVNAIADTRNVSFTNLSDFLRVVIEKDYFKDEKYALNSILEEKPDYGNDWIRECCEAGFFIHSANMTQRQMIQSGKFLLFHNDYEIDNSSKKYYFTGEIKPLSKSDSSIIKCIFTIPKDVKENILAQLNNIGINEKWLFSDSVDIVCKNITNHYKNRFIKTII